jgi:hypothetical protein
MVGQRTAASPAKQNKVKQQRTHLTVEKDIPAYSSMLFQMFSMII